MFSLISVFWFLKISFIFCHLSDPKCFWRIKDTENKIGDIETYCSFSISTKPGYVKNDYFSWNLDKNFRNYILYFCFQGDTQDQPFDFLCLSCLGRNKYELPYFT
uniref:Vomeronasal 2, receptor 72 n=1 Tax=Mus musculus TaxID=10090 RepID=A0A3B2W3M4_MOUSE